MKLQKKTQRYLHRNFPGRLGVDGGGGGVSGQEELKESLKGMRSSVMLTVDRVPPT